MKKFIWNGEEYQYEIIAVETQEYCYSLYTNIYKGVETVSKWTFLFWKSKELIEQPKKVLTLKLNIEDPLLNKQYVKEILDKYLAIFIREKEIERGELI